MKYIIDTDIGDDIDDAFALDYALKRNLDLLCVTTVFHNVRERAQIVKKMLSLYGKELPVYAGSQNAFDGTERKALRLCQWTADLNGYSPDGEEEDAIEAILSAARTYGKDLTVLAIGPLTNLAKAIRKDPEAMNGIGGIVLMGGDFKNHYAEWNIRCDIAAADVVFSSGVPVTAFGHELTSKTRLTREQQAFVLSMAQDKYHAYLAELSRLWLKSKPDGWLMVMHDVMVMRYAAEPAYCTVRTAPVAVETEGAYTAGMTVDLSLMDYCRNAGKTVTVAEHADVAEFITHFLRGIGYRCVPVENGENAVRQAL